MNVKGVITACVLTVTGSWLFFSCIERDGYNNNGPYNNNNNNTNNYNHNHPDSTYNYAFDEEFNSGDNHGWDFTSSSDSAYASISNGSYQYVDYGGTLASEMVVNTGANTQGNFTVSTRIKSNRIMGLVFGASSSDNGYAFYIDTAGNYSLYKEGTGTVASSVIIATTQDTLYSVKNNWNVLEVDQVNGAWTGYINGTQIFNMASRPISGNEFGFKILPGTIGYADYIIVKSN